MMRGYDASLRKKRRRTTRFQERRVLGRPGEMVIKKRDIRTSGSLLMFRSAAGANYSGGRGGKAIWAEKKRLGGC